MSPVILINPFEVPADKNEDFVARWREAAEYLRKQEGFVSTRMHESLDPSASFRFVNVAVWESVEDFQRAVGQPKFKKLGSGIPFPNHPALYRVADEIPPGADSPRSE